LLIWRRPRSARSARRPASPSGRGRVS
jgi:hypothetical protein